MKDVQINGRDIKEIMIWDGSRFRKTIGKVMTGEGLKDFYRPSLDFSDDFKTITGGRFLSSTAVVNNGLSFDTNITFTVESI